MRGFEGSEGFEGFEGVEEFRDDPGAVQGGLRRAARRVTGPAIRKGVDVSQELVDLQPGFRGAVGDFRRYRGDATSRLAC